MAQANFISGRPIMVPYTPAAALVAGQVVVVGSVPYVAHAPNPAFGTTPAQDGISARGGLYSGAADGALTVGGDAYWDDANNKFTATSAANTHFGTVVAGPTGDLVGAGPTADGDTVYVLHDPRGVAPGTLNGKKSEATASTTAALTAAQVLGGFVNSVPTGAVTLTLPTAALLVAALPGAKVGDAVDLSIENSSAGANSITLAAGSGGTLRGGATVAQNKSALVRILVTNVTASSEAYVAHSIVGA